MGRPGVLNFRHERGKGLRVGSSGHRPIRDPSDSPRPRRGRDETEGPPVRSAAASPGGPTRSGRIVRRGRCRAAGRGDGVPPRPVTQPMPAAEATPARGRGRVRRTGSRRASLPRSARMRPEGDSARVSGYGLTGPPHGLGTSAGGEPGGRRAAPPPAGGHGCHGIARAVLDDLPGERACADQHRPPSRRHREESRFASRNSNSLRSTSRRCWRKACIRSSIAWTDRCSSCQRAKSAASLAAAERQSSSSSRVDCNSLRTEASSDLAARSRHGRPGGGRGSPRAGGGFPPGTPPSRRG